MQESYPALLIAIIELRLMVAAKTDYDARTLGCGFGTGHMYVAGVQRLYRVGGGAQSYGGHLHAPRRHVLPGI
jgi:hypothetical protein